jgi:hypothetical protein
LTSRCRPKGGRSKIKKEIKSSPGKPAAAARGRGGKGKGRGRGAVKSYTNVEILEQQAALRHHTDIEQLNKDRTGIKMDHYYNMYGDERQIVEDLFTKIVNKEVTCKDVFGEVGRDKSNLMLTAHKYRLMMKAIRKNLATLNISVS